jgi:Fe-S-cluster-containing dehydrogenase component
MPTTTTTKIATTRCPKCDGHLVIEPRCLIVEPMIAAFATRGAAVTYRRREAPAALCTGCEFCVEIEIAVTA